MSDVNETRLHVPTEITLIAAVGRWLMQDINNVQAEAMTAEEKTELLVVLDKIAHDIANKRMVIIAQEEMEGLWGSKKDEGGSIKDEVGNWKDEGGSLKVIESQEETKL
jgi:hypothetical protein